MSLSVTRCSSPDIAGMNGVTLLPWLGNQPLYGTGNSTVNEVLTFRKITPTDF
jgi:hypothetical protein